MSRNRGYAFRVLDGHLHPAYRPLARALEQQLARSGGGASLCVYQDGRCVVDLWGGVADRAGRPWRRDTMSLSFSTTKGVASTALHMLADRGAIGYDEPVAAYWPEFGRAGKQGITVRQVLAHQAGLYDVRGMIAHARELMDWDRMTDALAAARPRDVGVSAYHALTYGFLVGELVRRVSGLEFSEFICREIAEPLGLDGLYCGVPPAELARAAELIGARRRDDDARRVSPVRRAVRRAALRAVGRALRLQDAGRALMPHGIGDLDFSSPELLRATIPAANGVFTARALARMYAALADGGSLDGVRLMSEATVRAASEVQSRQRDRVLKFDMKWRLGYHRVGSLRGSPRAAFGHFGYGGSGAWADPRRRLAVALTLNTGTGTPFGDLRILRINAVALACADGARCGQATPSGEPSPTIVAPRSGDLAV